MNGYNIQIDLLHNLFNDMARVCIRNVHIVWVNMLCLLCRFVISVGRRTHHIIGDGNLNSISFVS
jgi:hypothetical protein